MGEMAIVCEGVWKSYRIYHQHANTLKERFLARRNRYEDFWALRGIDVEVPVGTTLGIIGPNGSGKSTLLKTMARILTPNKGRVTVTGSVSPLLELGTGFHPELTGKENVFLGGALLGQTQRDVARRYDSIVEFAGIEAFMDTPVKNYSSGMYARLAFALAISVDPEILIVDEVLVVGDESFQLRCYDRLAQFRSEGRTIVIVSHSLESIRHLCARAIWIGDGVVRNAGPAEDVVKAYLGGVHGQVDHTPHATAADEEPAAPSEAEIVEVALLDAEGRPAGAFVTGDSLTVRLTCRGHHRIPDVACGIALFRADDLAYVFGQNSKECGLTLDLDGDAVIEFTVPSLPLLHGSYLLSVSLHDASWNNLYDEHERRYSFKVFRNPDLPIEGGLVHVTGHWDASSPVTV